MQFRRLNFRRISEGFPETSLKYSEFPTLTCCKNPPQTIFFQNKLIGRPAVLNRQILKHRLLILTLDVESQGQQWESTSLQQAYWQSWPVLASLDPDLSRTQDKGNKDTKSRVKMQSFQHRTISSFTRQVVLSWTKLGTLVTKPLYLHYIKTTHGTAGKCPRPKHLAKEGGQTP